MKIIISPAKKMRVDEGFPWQGLPVFLDRAKQLCARLQGMSEKELKTLWNCNDNILHQNMERLAHMDLERGLTPALLCYEGIQYQYMAPSVFTDGEWAYVQARLRILSGLYGLLRPLDGVRPYRLEMQAKLAVNGAKDLYAFWGRAIADALFADTDCVVDLASKEYSRCVRPYVPAGARFITCVFGQEQNGKVVEKGTLCKMARGEMVRFLAEHNLQQPEQMQAFDRQNHRFSPGHSTPDTYVFLQTN